MADLETEKTVIRSLLIANQKNVPLPTFLKDYRNSEGKDLPFRQFGYKNVREFLESLGDTVKVTVSAPNMVFLSPAITEDTQHIDKLVRTQKPTPSKRGKPKISVRHPQRQYSSRPSVARRPRSIVDSFNAKKSQGTILNGGYAHKTRSSPSSANNSKDSDVENWGDSAGWSARNDLSSTHGTGHNASCTTQAVDGGGFEHLSNGGEASCSKSSLYSWGAQAEVLSKNSSTVPPVSKYTYPIKEFVPASSVGSERQGFGQGAVNRAEGKASESSYRRTPLHEASYLEEEPPASKPLGTTWEACRSTTNISPVPSGFLHVPPRVPNPNQLPAPRMPRYSASQGGPAVFNQSLFYQSSLQSVQCGPYTPLLPVPTPHYVASQVPFGGLSTAVMGPPFMFSNPNIATALGGQLNVAAPPYVPKTFPRDPQESVTNNTTDKRSPEPHDSKEEGMPEDVIAGITRILKHHPDGLNVKLLPKLYEEEIGSHDYFFSSNQCPKELVIEIIKHVSMVSVSSAAGGEYTVKLVGPVQTQDSSQEQSSSNLPAEVAEGIENILRMHPEGVLANDLPILYEAEYGSHPYFTKDACSPTQLTLDIIGNNTSVTAVSLSNRKCLLKIVAAAPADTEKTEENYRRPSSSTESVSSEEGLRTYCRQTLPTTQEFSAMLGEVYSPGAFYILINGENTTGDLEKLMDEMRLFYDNDPPQSCMMNRDDIKADVPCAASYMVNGKPVWHRARILSRAASKVSISYVDFGICEQVSTERLRQIVPTQGVKVRLSGIQPCNSEVWSDEANVHFLNLMKNACLRCKVEEWDGEDIGVKLWKVGDEEHSIADMLVSDGYAVDVSAEQPPPFREWTIEPCYLRDGSQLSVITWQGVRYVTGSNVSHLFRWGPSAIDDKLEEKEIVFSVRVVSRSGNPALFADITREQCDNVDIESITLYKLQNLPDLLSLFCHPSREIRQEVESILCEEVYVSDTSSEDEEREEHHRKLERKLHALCEERSHLRMKVYAGESSHEDRLSFLESKIVTLEGFIDQQKAQRNLSRGKALNAVESRDATVNGAVAGAVQGLQTKLMELLVTKKS